ncbi:MAG: excinuclease ABC subunit C [Candidatus Saccharimonas sp.]|nr:MAG: excinuclease ABC subunit C [Candidatus Saccharimonas sp.]
MLATTDIVKLFQRIRDESHRFAVSYHTALKRQQQTKNQLEEIPGVGPKTRAKLLRKFGSMKKIFEAAGEDLEVEIGKQKAQLIKQFSESNNANRQ